jgi:hypothetical protein
MAVGTIDPSGALTYQQYNPGAANSQYLTPEAIRQLYEYATALKSRAASQGGGQQQPNVTSYGTFFSPWQGASNVVNALVGGMLQHKANEAGSGVQGYRAQTYGAGIPQPPYTPGSSNTSDTGSSEKTAALPEDPVELASLEGPTSGMMARSEAATSRQESGGNYGNVTTTINPRTGQPQSAIGKYGIMDFNVGPWTQEILGHAMTPEQFKNDPTAQDTVYRTKMAQYEKQYGVEGAGRAWLGGPGGVNHPERTDPLGTSVGDYGHKFAQMVAGPGARPAPGQVPMQQVPGGVGPSYQPIRIPQGVLPPASTFKPGDIGGLLATDQPGQAPMGSAAQQMYFSTQINPRVLGTLGGSIVVPPGGNATQGYYVPQMQTGQTSIGSLKFPFQYYYQPGAGNVQIPMGGQPAAAPIRPPAPSGPQGRAAPAPGEVPGRAVGSIPGGTQVASLGNIPIPQGVAGSAETHLPGPAPAAPPAAAAAVPGGAPAAPQEAQAATEGPPLPSVGQEFPGAPGGIPGLTPQLWQGYIDTLKADAAKGALQSGMTATAQKYGQRYDVLETQGNEAATQLPQIDSALALAQDPRVTQGLFSEPALFVKRLTDAMGISSNTAAPAQVFNKFIANSILQGLRAFTQGASPGQIRTAEIALQKLSSAGLPLQPTANIALLNLVKKMYQQNYDIGLMAANYAQGHGGKIDAGFDKQMLQYRKDHPVVTPAEVEHEVEAALPKGGQAGAPGGAPPTMPKAPPQAIEYLRSHPDTAAKFDQTFGVPGAAATILGTQK